MSWIKSALVYLGITALIVGAIWLFWGKSIETAWKSHGENPTKAAREVKAAAEKKVAKAMPDLREKTAPLSANIEKAKTGVAGILEHHVEDNRRNTAALLAQNDRRWAEILGRRDKIASPLPGLTGQRPPVTPTGESAAAAKASNPPKRGETKPKPEAPRRSKRLEEL